MCVVNQRRETHWMHFEKKKKKKINRASGERHAEKWRRGEWDAWMKRGRKGSVFWICTSREARKKKCPESRHPGNIQKGSYQSPTTQIYVQSRMTACNVTQRFVSSWKCPSRCSCCWVGKKIGSRFSFSFYPFALLLLPPQSLDYLVYTDTT